MSDDRFSDRTTSTLEHGTRDAADLRTHTERVNGMGPGRFGDAEALDEPVFDDEDAPLAPYRTTEKSVVAGAIVAPGSIVYLKPHQVGAHHVAMPVEAEPEPEPAPEPEPPAEEPPHAEEAAAPEVA